MAICLNITSPDEALDIVPRRRAFTNPDGSPSFRLMLAHMRDKCETWREQNRYTSHPEWAWRRLGCYAIRTIGESLRNRGAEEAASRAESLLSSAADTVDASYAKHKLQGGDHSRACAIVAFATGRPALGTRCMYGSAIVDLINLGDASIDALAASPLDLAGVVALNAAGDRFVRKAQALAAGPISEALPLAA